MSNNRILVVDDNGGIHQDFRKILQPSFPDNKELNGLESRLFGDENDRFKEIEEIRYQLTCAHHAEEGFALFTKEHEGGEPFGVIFADVRMPPGEDGVHLIERIWKIAPLTQVVVMTAFSDYSWEDLIERFGWSDRLIILRKPFDAITIKQLALMLSRRWVTEGILLEQRDTLRETVRQKEQAELKLARFREVLEQAGDGILMADPINGELIDFNATLVSLLGYQTEEMAQLKIPDILAEGHFSEGWSEGCTLIEQFRHKDGSLIPVEVSLTLKPFEDRQFLLAVARDISERVASDRERRQLEAQLRHAQKMQTIGTLASGIAHDFNNILSPIMVYTEMAIEDTTSTRIREDLEQVAKAACRARDLVQHILNFSHQVEKDRMPLKLHLIVKEALHLVRASLPSTIRIVREVPDCGQVLAGPSQLHQVMMNLCTNARHAMMEHGGELGVRLKRTMVTQQTGQGPKPGEYCVLAVSDTGVGIAPDLLDRIFEPFFTTRPETQGTGLGLAMVKDIVKAHEGAIEVESTPGKGSTFQIYLPIALSEEAADPDGTEEPHGGKERILFVDDEEMLVRMMSELLERYGYKVNSFTDSRQALTHFKAHPYAYDVVITDYTMPHMVGTMLAQEVMEVRPGMPVILCTGFGEAVSEEICREMGIKAYLLKPIVARDLVGAIEHALL